MGWLRFLESLFEQKLEGGYSGQMHVLEAARIASRVQLDNKFRPDRSKTLVPNLITVPFNDLQAVPQGFASEVERQLAGRLVDRGFKTLAPLMVVPQKAKHSQEELEVFWTDANRRVILGFVEGTAGPADKALFCIGLAGIIVGRGAEANMRVGDPGLSRNHVRLRIVEENRVVVEDLASHNGTYLGRHLLASPVSVRSGSTIKCGESSLRLWTIPGQAQRFAARLRKTKQN